MQVTMFFPSVPWPLLAVVWGHCHGLCFHWGWALGSALAPAPCVCAGGGGEVGVQGVWGPRPLLSLPSLLELRAEPGVPSEEDRQVGYSEDALLHVSFRLK